MLVEGMAQEPAPHRKCYHHKCKNDTATLTGRTFPLGSGLLLQYSGVLSRGRPWYARSTFKSLRNDSLLAAHNP